MAGLVPAIHAFLLLRPDVDTRDKPAHDSVHFRYGIKSLAAAPASVAFLHCSIACVEDPCERGNGVLRMIYVLVPKAFNSELSNKLLADTGRETCAILSQLLS
jgi:hypothetical protein